VSDEQRVVAHRVDLASNHRCLSTLLDELNHTTTTHTSPTLHCCCIISISTIAVYPQHQNTFCHGQKTQPWN